MVLECFRARKVIFLVRHAFCYFRKCYSKCTQPKVHFCSAEHYHLTNRKTCNKYPEIINMRTFVSSFLLRLVRQVLCFRLNFFEQQCLITVTDFVMYLWQLPIFTIISLHCRHHLKIFEKKYVYLLFLDIITCFAISKRG